MQKFLLISDLMVPMIIFGTIIYGLYKKIAVYDVFVEGAKKGMNTVISILPTIVGLMVSVGVLRASGFLNFLVKMMEPLTSRIHFPAPLLPLAIVKLFSSSAATGILLDLYKEYGTDSFIGITASIMLSSTETVFYTMSVYFLTVKVTKTRWTLAGALLSTAAGILASVILAR